MRIGTKKAPCEGINMWLYRIDEMEFTGAFYGIVFRKQE
jgi:hypothetical protein